MTVSFNSQNPFKIIAAARTDVGGRRRFNADFYAAFPERGLFVLADGVGDNQKGKMASEMAVQSIVRSFWINAATSPSERIAKLTASIQRANSELFDHAKKNPRLGKMGTTVVALHLDRINGWSHVAHVGDSRAYRIRQNNIERLTEDHSEFAEWERHRVGPPPSKNVLTQAVGTEENVFVDVTTNLLEGRDLFLLCSDGLYKAVSDDRMRDLVLSAPDLATAGAMLIWEANQANASDNITVGLIHAVF